MRFWHRCLLGFLSKTSSVVIQKQSIIQQFEKQIKSQWHWLIYDWELISCLATVQLKVAAVTFAIAVDRTLTTCVQADDNSWQQCCLFRVLRFNPGSLMHLQLSA